MGHGGLELASFENGVFDFEYGVFDFENGVVEIGHAVLDFEDAVKFRGYGPFGQPYSGSVPIQLLPAEFVPILQFSIRF